MLVLMILGLFSLGLAQESSGSLLDIYETDELTASELEDQKDNIESNGYETSQPEAEELNVSGSQKAAFYGLYNELTEITSVNSYLKAKNSQLQETAKELKSELENSAKKNYEYSTDYEKSSEDLIQKITTLDDYNHQLIREARNKANNALPSEAATEENENDDDKEISTTMVLCITLGLFFLLLFGLKSLFGSGIDEIFNPALYSLFEDTTILLFVSSVACLVYYLDPFDNIEYEDILGGIAVFTLIWLVFGIFLILVAQGFFIS